MNKKEIILQFPNKTSDLTGNQLGRKVFEEQVEEHIVDEDTQLLVVVPSSINDVGTSFIQGIYANLSKKFGGDKALSIMTLYGENEETNEKIERVIKVYGI